jgi:2-haloacid dehalogenase
VTVQAVIFDIGNVLITWQPEQFYDRALGPEVRARLFAEVDLHRMNDDVDRGAPFRATVEDWAVRHPDWASEIRWWHDRWDELASPAIDRSIRSLRALRARGVPVFALSNIGAEVFDHAARRVPALAEFDRAYVSGRLGCAKPDAAIYRAVEQDCGLPPSALLFTDDKAENVAAAAMRGWGTHLFDGPGPWAERLLAEGLLTEDEAA